MNTGHGRDYWSQLDLSSRRVAFGDGTLQKPGRVGIAYESVGETLRFKIVHHLIARSVERDEDHKVSIDRPNLTTCHGLKLGGLTIRLQRTSTNMKTELTLAKSLKRGVHHERGTNEWRERGQAASPW